MITNFAPIFIPTISRYEHFKRCIESLSKCKYANKTTLIIALDYPLKEQHWNGYNAIQNYIKVINGFYKVRVIKRETNYGVIRNFYESVDFLFKEYDRLIISEDDNEFAPNFLSLINNGLEVYNFREDIFSVTGYNSPIKMPKDYPSDLYLRRGFAAWGVGIWKKKWYNVDWTMKEFNDFIDNKMELKRFSKVSQRAIPQLLNMRKTQTKLGDGIIAVHLFIYNMYSIYPVISRVRNHGHDGSGEHCSVSNKYSNQVIYEKNEDALFPPDIKPDLKLLSFVQRQYKISLLEKLKSKFPSKLRVILKKFIEKKNW